MGGLAILTGYLVLILWIIKIASEARDRFGATVCVGVRRRCCSGTSPSTSAWSAASSGGRESWTLPLISYGGSSILTIMVAPRLVMNVSVRPLRVLTVLRLNQPALLRQQFLARRHADDGEQDARAREAEHDRHEDDFSRRRGARDRIDGSPWRRSGPAERDQQPPRRLVDERHHRGELVDGQRVEVDLAVRQGAPALQQDLDRRHEPPPGRHGSRPARRRPRPRGGPRRARARAARAPPDRSTPPAGAKPPQGRSMLNERVHELGADYKPARPGSSWSIARGGAAT